MTKHIRLVVYSYLRLKEVAVGIGRLSKVEREAIKSSEIAREGKHLMININDSVHCLLHGDRLQEFINKRYQYLWQLTDTLTFFA